jgi:hypothetical protein
VFGKGLGGLGGLSNFVVSIICSTLSSFVVLSILAYLAKFRYFYYSLDFKLFRVFLLLGFLSLFSCMFAIRLLEPCFVCFRYLASWAFFVDSYLLAQFELFRVFSLFGFLSLVSCVFAIRLLEPLSLIFTMSFFGHFCCNFVNSFFELSLELVRRALCLQLRFYRSFDLSYHLCFNFSSYELLLMPPNSFFELLTSHALQRLDCTNSWICPWTPNLSFDVTHRLLDVLTSYNKL